MILEFRFFRKAPGKSADEQKEYDLETGDMASSAGLLTCRQKIVCYRAMTYASYIAFATRSHPHIIGGPKWKENYSPPRPSFDIFQPRYSRVAFHPGQAGKYDIYFRDQALFTAR
ncbi:MAG TPA: hypothetical protein DDW43_08130 [Nitrosomonas sp.]|nr:hypothetical protein [Nitrosomonas sp.]